MRRFTIAEAQRQVFDLAIIGGGVTGAAIAREARLRGLSVVLAEKGDFASGTSSRSTKLLHGGLRYLETFEFKLVREACRERELMLRLAPHLAHVRPFVYLVYRNHPVGMAKLNLGLTLYDLFSGAPLKRHHHMLRSRTLLARLPHLNPEGLVGGGWYFDFLTDDARLTIDTLKGAAEAGALVANYMEVRGLEMEQGKARGIQVQDLITGEQGTVRAHQVVNAAGPWADAVRFLEEREGSPLLRPTKGVHLVVRRADFPLQHAVFAPSPRDGRMVFSIPALDPELVYVGTTDTDYEGPLDRVLADVEDIEYLLEAANFVLPEAQLGPGQVVASWAGLRPLVKPEGRLTTGLVSREQQITFSAADVLTIMGGKLTTARLMGEQVVEAAIPRLQRTGNLGSVPASRSALVPVSGGGQTDIFHARRKLAGVGADSQVKARWLAHYGGNAAYLGDLTLVDPGLGDDLGVKHLSLAEVDYAVREEMAQTVTDFMARRASLLNWLPDGGLSLAALVAGHMGGLLGWDPGERARQVAAYRELVATNRVHHLDPPPSAWGASGETVGEEPSVRLVAKSADASVRRP